MNDTRPTAPLATLEEMIGIPVTVRTKAGQLIDGTLAGYDEHLNLTLEAGPATDSHDTDDDPRLIRGNRVVSITHPPIERASTADETNTASNSDGEREPSA